MMHFVRVVLFLTVFLIPLLPATSYFGYEQIKVLVFISLISLASIFWMFERPEFKWTKISIAGALFIFTLFITSFLGIDFKTSLLGDAPYFQGIILYAYFFLFYILVYSSKIKMEVWSKILVWSAILVSFVAIRDWVLLNILGQSVPLYAGRVVSTFGQPNFYAGFLLLTLPFALSRSDKLALSKNWLVSIILMLAILASGSRSAMILMFGLLIFWYIEKLAAFKKSSSFFIGVLILLFAGFILGQVWEGINQKELIQVQNSEWLFHNSPEKRILILPIVGELIAKKPILGYGLENTQGSFSDYFKGVNFNVTTNSSYHSLKDVVVDGSHNYILDVLFFSGFLGLGLWVTMVILLIKKARGVLLTGLIIYLIWIQFQNQSIVHLIYFWLLAGLIDKDSNI